VVPRTFVMHIAKGPLNGIGPGTIELFRNKRPGKLSSKKAMEGANRWVYSSETSVR
jgi:hypothetical protein